MGILIRHDIPSRRHWCVWLVVFFTLVFPSVTSVAVAGQASKFGDPDDVKFALAYSLLKYLSWPDESFREDDATMLFGLVGDAKLAESLRSSLESREREVSGRKVEIKTFESLSKDSIPELRECHAIYFLGDEKSVSKNLSIFTTLTDSATPVEDTSEDGHTGTRPPQVLIGEGRHFIEEGGMFGIFEAGGGPAFEMNITALNSAGMRYDARLPAFSKRELETG